METQQQITNIWNSIKTAFKALFSYLSVKRLQRRYYKTERVADHVNIRGIIVVKLIELDYDIEKYGLENNKHIMRMRERIHKISEGL